MTGIAVLLESLQESNFLVRFYRNSCFETQIVIESAQQLLYDGRPLLHVSATFSHRQVPRIALTFLSSGTILGPEGLKYI